MSSQLREPSVQEFPHTYPIQEQLRFLVRYATLAPSTRNTQPWRFRVDREPIEIRPDLTRWHRVADRDRRELYLSLGCAIENLMVAAEQFGFRHTVVYQPDWRDEEVAAMLAFGPGGHGSPERRGLTLSTLLSRRSDHGRFLERELSTADMDALRLCLAPIATSNSLSRRSRNAAGLYRGCTAWPTRSPSPIQHTAVSWRTGWKEVPSGPPGRCRSSAARQSRAAEWRGGSPGWTPSPSARRRC